MQILVNIGNTHTQVAKLTDDGIEIVGYCQTKELADISMEIAAKFASGSQILVATVVPETKEILTESWADFSILWLNYELVSKIVDFSDVDPTTIGADRLANALAATTLERPAVIIDAGTCITTEIIDESNKFLGGAIIPGRKLMRQALHHHTAQLPKVELTEALPNPIGKNTVDAMKAVDLSVIGGLKELISRSQESLEKQLKVYITGGDAPYFAENIEKAEQLGPNFTLEGLALLLKFL